MPHSPGPWEDIITEEGDLIVRLGNQCRGYAFALDFGDMEVTTGEDHWNARLVAAAPDLQEALQLVWDWSTLRYPVIREKWGRDFTQDEVREKMRSALDKSRWSTDEEHEDGVQGRGTV